MAILALAIWNYRSMFFALETFVLAGETPDPEPHDLLNVNGHVYFAYDDGIHGEELWRAAPSGSVELVADIAPGPVSSHPRQLLRLTPFQLVFSASTPEHGEELWIAGQEREGHSLRVIKDIIPGPMSSEPLPLFSHEALVYFYATTLSNGHELWCTNTREPQTALVYDLMPGTAGSMPTTPRVLGDAQGIYMMALASADDGVMLCRYHYANTGIRIIADVSEDSGDMALAGTRLIFSHHDPDHGTEVWVHDPNVGGIELLSDLWPGQESSHPRQFFAWKGRVLFQAATPESGIELWASDGTAAGTVFIADINPGTGDSDPFGFQAASDIVYFRAKTAEAGRELWATDGTTAGTRLYADVWPGPASSEPYNLTLAGSILFFSADDGVHGEELWVSRPGLQDGQPQLVADLWPGEMDSEPHAFQQTDETTGIFAAKIPGRGTTLVAIDWQNERVSLRVLELPRAGAIKSHAS
jgi:ELWxxDGT repeat protein